MPINYEAEFDDVESSGKVRDVPNDLGIAPARALANHARLLAIFDESCIVKRRTAKLLTKRIDAVRPGVTRVGDHDEPDGRGQQFRTVACLQRRQSEAAIVDSRKIGDRC